MQVLQTKFMKTCLLVLIMSVMSGAINAQVFMNPHYRAKNAETADLYSVEITETNTIVCLTLLGAARSSIYISSKTYIEGSEGGKPLYIQKAEGLYFNSPNYDNLIKIFNSSRSEELILDNQISNFSPTLRRVKLYFPKIDRKSQTINLRAGKDGNFWHFFEINVARDIGVDKAIQSSNKGREGDCYFIDDPGYTAKSGGFQISKIELCDTATILHFNAYVSPSGWVSVPSKSCIRDSDGGDNLFVMSAEGTKIDQKITGDMVPEGTIYYKLFFPPIKRSVKKIDFREVNKGGSWFVYELDVDVD